MKTYLVNKKHLAITRLRIPQGGETRWSTPLRKSGLTRFGTVGELCAMRDGCGTIVAYVTPLALAQTVKVLGTVANQPIAHQQDVFVEWV
jgi:hypothetical protein